MDLDFFTVDRLRKSHPGWKLLLADTAPLATSFLFDIFVAGNIREVSRTDLADKLEDLLYSLRDSLGSDAFPRSAVEYLDEWADEEHNWLRKYYPPAIDEPYYDLTPAAEKAIQWLDSLGRRSFVGTESRLMTVLDLLRQMVEGNEEDPEERVRELERRKAEIERNIERIRAGDGVRLDAPRLRDRFQQMSSTARELLGDFREVEQNFRHLDRATRERIALWNGSKAELLDQVFGESEAIDGSEQGRSFRAFWDFLMASDRQEELSNLLNKVFQMEIIQSFEPDPRLKTIHHDWLDAGDHAQRTVALLSQQLRRFLDDQVLLENRRIMEVLRHIEVNVIALQGELPRGPFMAMDESKPEISLPFERALYISAPRLEVDSDVLVTGQGDVDVSVLFSQVVVDTHVLETRIRNALDVRPQLTLPELLLEHPLEQGLAELVAYLSIATQWQDSVRDGPKVAIAADEEDRVIINQTEEVRRYARIPRIIFQR